MKGREEKGANMDGTLRNMASVYISKGDRMLLLNRQGGRVVNNVWVGSAGGNHLAWFIMRKFLNLNKCWSMKLKKSFSWMNWKENGHILKYSPN